MGFLRKFASYLDGLNQEAEFREELVKKKAEIAKAERKEMEAERRYKDSIANWELAGAPVDGDVYEATVRAYHKFLESKGECDDVFRSYTNAIGSHYKYKVRRN